VKVYRTRLHQVILPTLLFLFLISGIQAQTRSIDSIKQKLKGANDDTNKVNTLVSLDSILNLESRYSDALETGNEIMRLSKILSYQKGITEAYDLIGSTYYRRGDYEDALRNHFHALPLSRAIGDKRQEAFVLTNIGNVYSDQGNYAEALKYFEIALRLSTEIGFKLEIGNLYNNIGIVHLDLGNYPEALRNNLLALRMREEEGTNRRNIAGSYNNIGNIYYRQANYTEALKNHRKALKIREEIGDKFGIAMSFDNLANVYNNLGNFQEALKSHLSSLALHKEMGDKRNLASSYNNIGVTYQNMKNYPEAIRYFIYSKQIQHEIGDLDGLGRSFSNLGYAYVLVHKLQDAKSNLDSSESIFLKIHHPLGLEGLYYEYTLLDSAAGNFSQAYLHFKKYLVYHDSLFNEENSKKTVRAEMNFEFDKKQAIAQAEKARIAQVAAAESKRQRIVIFSVSGLLLLICAFAAFAYRSYRLKKRANFRLEIQKKNIDDSIRYAQRIQQAILPKALFLPGEVQEHFVLYLPKDIVSGDFYWRHQEGRELFFAAVDCTGHGVPGAMMSMLGYDLLEYAVKDKGLREPEEILHLLNRQIIEKLNGGNSDTSTDGMDLTLCRLNLDTLQLVYAGAKNDLFVISDNELQVLRVTKCAIGYSLQTVYTQATRSLKKNDEIFLLTDGYSDQKGGPQKKKFMLRKLKALLMELSSLPCQDQRQKLLAEFESWKGSAPQKDDILFVGFRI